MLLKTVNFNCLFVFLAYIVSRYGYIPVKRIPKMSRGTAFPTRLPHERPVKDSAQPAHPRNLIRVFTVHLWFLFLFNLLLLHVIQSNLQTH